METWFDGHVRADPAAVVGGVKAANGAKARRADVRAAVAIAARRGLAAEPRPGSEDCVFPTTVHPRVVLDKPAGRTGVWKGKGQKINGGLIW